MDDRGGAGSGGAATGEGGVSEYHGHMTLEDGSHVPLTAEQAEALWTAAEEAQAARAAAMPTEADALQQFFSALTRLEDFGWRDPCYLHHAGECDMIELGSTGIHRGAYSGDWPGGAWFYRDEIDTANPALCRAVEAAA